TGGTHMRWIVFFFLVVPVAALATGPFVGPRSLQGGRSNWVPPDPPPLPDPLEPGELPPDITLAILPPDRQTVWNPGIPGGIPQDRQVHVVLVGLPSNGTGDVSPLVQSSLDAAGAAYESTGI